MVTSLAALLFLMAVGLVGLGLWAEGGRRSRDRWRDRCERQGESMAKKLTAAEKKAAAVVEKNRELERDNGRFAEQNEQLGKELAEERKEAGHLREANASLKAGLERRDLVLSHLLEVFESEVKPLIGCRRAT